MAQSTGTASASRAVKGEPQSDDHVKQTVSNMISSAKAYVQNTKAEREREVVMRYYFAEPYGDEQEDRSSFVTSEVKETITWLLPPVKRKFLWSNRPVEFEASHDTEDMGGNEVRNLLMGKVSDRQASDASEYVAHVFYRENNGFKALSDVFWDAMVSKTGIMQHYYKEWQEQTTQRFFNLSEPEVDMLMSEEMPEDVEAKYEVDDRRPMLDEMGDPIIGPDGEPVEVVDISVTKTYTRHGTVVCAVPPEDAFVMAGDTVISDDMQGFFHRIKKPRYMWLDDGYDWDTVMEMPSVTVETEEIQITRQGRSTTAVSSVDPMQQEVVGWQSYVNIDRDGNGTTELLKIVLGGEGGDFLMTKDGKNCIEPVNEIPYTDFCAFRIPHTFYGDCPGDRVADLQRLGSVNTRQRQDFGYEVNTPTLMVGEAGERVDQNGSLTLRDAMDRAPGDVIRVGDRSQVGWDRPPDISPLFAQIDDWIKEKIMTRTGSMPIAPATDPDSLNPNSATEVADRRSSHDELIDEMAGEFANSLKRVFLQILKVEVRYARKPKTIKVGDSFRTIDARLLPSVMGVSVNVGQGSGISEKSVAGLAGTLQTQSDLVSQFGWADDNPSQGFVYKTQYHQTLADLVRAQGMDAPHKYYTDPTGKGEIQIPPQLIQQIEMQAMQKAQQSVLVQMEKYKVDSAERVALERIAADMQKAAAQTQQKDTESRRETAQKEADSRRDAEVSVYETDEREATKRQEIAADLATGSVVNISG